MVDLLTALVVLDHLAAGVIEVLDIHASVAVVVDSRPSLGVVGDAVLRLTDD